MDVLKSEILRKRQLVEDRNLLVVRSLGSWRGVRRGRRPEGSPGVGTGTERVAGGRG